MERVNKERQVRIAKEKKGVEAQKVKPPTHTRSTDTLIEDEDENENRKKNKTKEARSCP